MPPSAHPEGPPAPETSPRSNGANGSHADEPAVASLRAISARLAELRAYAGYFLAAKLDRIKLTIRQLVLAAVLGAVGLVAVIGLIVTAIVLTLRGISGALSEICGGRPWLGDLICGVLVLAILVIGLWVAVKRFTQMSRESTVQKYESEQFTQHSNLGADVSGHSAAPAGRPTL